MQHDYSCNSSLHRERPYTPELIGSNTREVLLTGRAEGRGMAIHDSDYGYNYYNENKEEEKNEIFIAQVTMGTGKSRILRY